MQTIADGLANDFQTMAQDELTAPIAGVRTVAELFDLLEQRDYELSDLILHTLLARLDEDPQARTLVLHAMQPAIITLARQHHRRNARAMSSDDALCHVLEAFYDALEYPSIRAKRTRVAARITGQIRTLLSRRVAEETSSQTVCWEDELALSEAQLLTPEPTTAHDSQMDLLEGLAWARDHEIITLDEARFLIAVYSPDTGITLEDLNLEDLSPAAVRKRASRLSQRIAQAIIHTPDATAALENRMGISR